MQIVIDHKLFAPGSVGIIVWPLLLLSICIFLWLKNVFRRSEYLRLARNEGVKLLRGVPSGIGILAALIRFIARGRLGDIYVIAKIDGAYCGIAGEDNTTESLDKKDHVGFVFLIDSPIDSEIEILVASGKRIIPQTGMSEIDSVINSCLARVSDFRAILTIKREYICLKVMGGAWFGKRFQSRIIKGFEIARKMDEALRKKYKYKSWDGLAMKWDYNTKAFFLVKESQLSGYIFQ